MLFNRRTARGNLWNQAHIVMNSMATGERTVLIARGQDAKYLTTGHLVYSRDAALLRHYRIYLGKGGCHEAFAQSVYGSGTGKFSRRLASFANGIKLRLK